MLALYLDLPREDIFLEIFASIATSCVSDALAYVLVSIGVFLTLRVLVFPDLTVDGSFVTGGSIAALMIQAGYNPFLATFIALAAGFLCGLITGLTVTTIKRSPQSILTVLRLPVESASNCA